MLRSATTVPQYYPDRWTGRSRRTARSASTWRLEEKSMQGLMQRHPLLLSSIISHAARHHGGAELVSVLSDRSLHRTNYGETERRARRILTALRGLGVSLGDRVATLACNGYRH